MNPMRDRVKEHYPSVLLTLLSIVQALAFGMLWEHIDETDYLFEASQIALLSWLQIFSTLVVFILIFLIYGNNVMRLRWVPTTTETALPFAVGLLEFILVKTLGPENLGPWFLLMAVVFVTMTLIAYSTMRKARLEAENEPFFRNRGRATIRDYIPNIITVIIIFGVGLHLWETGDQGSVALIAMCSMCALLMVQFYSAASFWSRSLAPMSENDKKEGR